MSNLSSAPSSDNPPTDIWARWRKPGGRMCTLVIVLTPGNPEYLPAGLGHLPALALVEEVRSEIGTEQSLIAFWVGLMPHHRWQAELEPDQRFMAQLERTDDDRWIITWQSRLEP